MSDLKTMQDQVARVRRMISQHSNVYAASDANADGVLSPDEWAAFLKKAQPDLPPEQFAAVSKAGPPSKADIAANASANGYAYTPAQLLSGVQSQQTGVRDSNNAAVDTLLGQPLTTLSNQGVAASGQETGALNTFLDQYGALQTVDPGKQIDFGGYVGDASTAWGNVGASAESQANQADAIAKSKALTNPQATAQEKFLEEMARQKENQTLQQQSNATANDMRARGVYGSGAELAQGLANRQQAGQSQMLSDLGTNAAAVQRSMQALQQYGALSGQQVGQTAQVAEANASGLDAAAQFNKQSQIKHQTDLAGFKQSEAQRTFADTTSERDKAGNRLATEADARNKTIGDIYNRQKDVYGNKERGVQLKTGTALAGQTPVSDTGTKLAGSAANDQAIALATAPKAFNPLDPGTYFSNKSWSI